jgi:hypothetical protein
MRVERSGGVLRLPGDEQDHRAATHRQAPSGLSPVSGISSAVAGWDANQWHGRGRLLVGCCGIHILAGLYVLAVRLGIAPGHS